MRGLLKYFLLISLAGATSAQAAGGRSGKFEVGAGFYSFSASNKRNDTSNTISGVGAYRLAYRHPLFDQWEFDAGYSLTASQTFSGDLAFGVDLGLNYYPWTLNGPQTLTGEGVLASFDDRWRPYVGFAFQQRNFQSTSSQYAGGGFKIGAEYFWTNRTYFHSSLRASALGGPNQSTAQQTEILFGLTFYYR